MLFQRKDDYIINVRLFGLSVFLSEKNFFPVIRAIYGKLPEIENIDAKLLSILFPELKFSGVFENIEYQDFINKIFEKMLFSNEKKTKKIVELFLSIVSYPFKNSMHKKEYFLYIPDINDYFLEGLGWNICFFIACDKEIICIYGKAWNQLLDCPFNDEDTLNGRKVFEERFKNI